MKRYHSAFAAPSGFVVSSGGKPSKATRREGAHRAAEVHAIVPAPAKPQSVRDLRDRAA